MSVLIPSARAAVTVGGRVFTDLTNLFILKTTHTANAYSVLYNTSASTPAAYQVTTAKTFRLRAAKFDQISAASAAVGPAIFYADSSLGQNSSTSPTNPVGMLSGNASSTDTTDCLFTAQMAAGTLKEVAVSGRAAAQKYPHMQNNSASGILYLYGYEE